MLDWVHDHVKDQTAASRKPSLMASSHTSSFPLRHLSPLKYILGAQDCELRGVGVKSAYLQLSDPSLAQALAHSRHPINTWGVFSARLLEGFFTKAAIGRGTMGALQEAVSV